MLHNSALMPSSPFCSNYNANAKSILAENSTNAIGCVASVILYMYDNYDDYEHRESCRSVFNVLRFISKLFSNALRKYCLSDLLMVVMAMRVLMSVGVGVGMVVPVSVIVRVVV